MFSHNIDHPFLYGYLEFFMLECQEDIPIAYRRNLESQQICKSRFIKR